MAKQTTLKEFESVYPKLEEALLDHARSYKLPQEQLDWFKKASSTLPPLSSLIIEGFFNSQQKKIRENVPTNRMLIMGK